MNNFDINTLAWEKMQGLLPAIVQDAQTSAILMLGYMNPEALEKTLTTKWVTFFSRSKNALWTKGETSGNRLALQSISTDCDQDALLILATPEGPTCHTGTTTCFKDAEKTDWAFLSQLEKTITEREQHRPEESYVTSLFNAGLKKIAQKVGEEGVEVALAAVAEETSAFCNEAADLLFHLLVLLRARRVGFAEVIQTLQRRA